MIAVATAVELLYFSPMSDGTRQLFSRLTAASRDAGIELRPTTTYHGASPWLMLWGPGGVNRFDPMRRHMAAGGRVIAWDAAYWHRDRQHRLSIDAAHPQAWVMRRNWPASRLARDPVSVANRWDPNGPVIVAGIGAKASLQYGSDVPVWEDLMIQTCQRKGWEVRYRPKPGHYRQPSGVTQAGTGPIESVLSGASLLVTWHSNVAVDAIRMGIPVVCRDGAAKAVYPEPLEAEHRPIDPAVRDQFLANLAWFQWSAYDAAGCWAFLQELLA